MLTERWTKLENFQDVSSNQRVTGPCIHLAAFRVQEAGAPMEHKEQVSSWPCKTARRGRSWRSSSKSAAEVPIPGRMNFSWQLHWYDEIELRSYAAHTAQPKKNNHTGSIGKNHEHLDQNLGEPLNVPPLKCNW